MDRFYRGVRAVARFWLWFFFKSVDVRRPDRVPDDGPVLLCINHPNNFIDSLVVGAAVRRKVHYLATAALFRDPFVARFLLAGGAIPVWRRQDEGPHASTRPISDRPPSQRSEHTAPASTRPISDGPPSQRSEHAAPATMDRNADTFAACAAAFERGALIAIYPEGTTHAEARVQRIKTGAARIALAWEATHPRTLTMLPVGLTFEARKSFRARVLVSFGAALPLHAYADAYREDPVKAVDALTRHLQASMEAEVVNVERIDDARLLQSIETLYRDVLAREVMEARGVGPRDVDLVRLSRSIVDAITWFKSREPERVEAIWQRIRTYRALLAQYHLRDETVRARLERLPARQRLVYSWDAVVGFPFFVYGALVNALPYLLPRWLARRIARKETDYATVRLLAAIVAVPVFYGLETWLVLRVAGGLAAALFAISLPLSGLIAYRYLAGAGRFRSRVRFALLTATHGAAARRLVVERQSILGELERAKTEWLAATKGSSF
jgi:glycerol-3-phosphate O-acyltransferase / dihydroxyacetone phosphate acyltransferase